MSTSLAGRPVVMQESRALILVEDSGNKHAQIPQHLSQTILPNKPSCNTLQNSLRNELTNWHRKCRSETARLIRKTNRANKKRFQTQLFRQIRSQAIGLARQLPAYIAQDPTNILRNSFTIYPYETNNLTLGKSCTDKLSESIAISEYQDAVLRFRICRRYGPKGPFSRTIGILSSRCPGRSHALRTRAKYTKKTSYSAIQTTTAPLLLLTETPYP